MAKERIAANGDYNLGGDRYREGATRDSVFPHRRLDEVARITAGNSAPQGDEYFAGGDAPFVRTSDVGAVHLSDNFVSAADKVNTKAIEELRLELFSTGTILFPKSGASTFLNHRVVMGAPAYVSSHLACIICDESKALPKFAYHLLCRVDAREITPDQAYPSLRLSEIGAIQIPLPPLEVQKEIVAEIEGYQKVIDGARAVLDNYRPRIPVHPDWPMVELGNVCGLMSGGTPSKANDAYWIGEIPWVSAKDLKVDRIYDATMHVSDAAVAESATRIAPVGSLLVLVRGMGLANGVPICEVMKPCAFNQDLKALHPDATVVTTRFFAFALRQQEAQFRKVLETAAHGTLKINSDDLRQIKIPLPPLATQQAIVAEIEAEQVLVAANRELTARFEKKTQATLARVWGEDEPDGGCSRS